MRERREFVTIIIVVANVLVFLGLSSQGMTEDPGYMLNHGAMYVPYMIRGQEWWRLFTSMFLHFGFSHLMNNMVVLFLMGRNLEMELGAIKYLIIYFAGGVCGNLLSMASEVISGEFSVGAGASGAIFAVIGALLYIAIRNHGRVGTVSGKGIMFMIFCTLYYGFTSTGVDNFAHIGGLISGFLLGVLLYRKKNRESSMYAGDGIYMDETMM